MHLVRRDTENVDELTLHAEGALAADVHRVAAARLVERRDGGAGLHRADHDATIDEVELGDVSGLRERLRDLVWLAVEIIERDVPRRIVVELWCAGLGGFARSSHGGQGFDIDLN